MGMNYLKYIFLCTNAYPSLPYNRYRVFHGVKMAGPYSWPTTPSSAKVEESLEL
jgi:hypothetical protein